MKKYTFVLAVVLVLAVAVVAFAQGLGPQLAQNSCDHAASQIDLSTQGPVETNDQLIESRLSFCPDTNEAVSTTWARWAGWQSHTGQVWVNFCVETIQGQTIFCDTKETFGAPDTDNEAITVPVRWELPLDGKQYRVEISSALCDITASACQKEQEFAWFVTANFGSIKVVKAGHPLEGAVFHKKVDGEILETHEVTADDLEVIGGETFAVFVFDEITATREGSTVVEVVEDMSGQPYGVQVVYPPDGKHRVVVHAGAQNHTVDFVNRDNRVHIPVVQKPYPPETCTREINLQYDWHGERQNRTYVFQPVTASVQDLGVLAYGALVHMNMTDGGIVDEITLVRHFPSGDWDYVYTDWSGPYEVIYGAFDPLYDDENIHLLQPGRLWGIEWNYFNEDGIRCMFSAQMVWDPPEGPMIAVQVGDEWLYHVVGYDDPADFRLPEKYDRIMVMHSLEEGWVDVTLDQIRKLGLID